MTSNQQWLLKQRPQGLFKVEDFELKQSEVSELSTGQALLKVCYLSFDPTQRIWASIDSYLPKVPLGQVMRALGIGQVVESKSSKYKVGDLVFTDVGWQQYKLLDDKVREAIKPQIVPSFLDPELFLAMSMTGSTAMIGLSHIGKVRKGQQVLISGAAGAVGSIACQIAKIKGARVIAIAGGDKKCRHLIDDLKVDAVIDYKNSDVIAEIDKQCANGIDLYFDNVGGEILDHVLLRINKRARIILCGAISQYTKINQENIEQGLTPATKNTINLIAQSASMHGFVITDYQKQIPGCLISLLAWLKKGKLQCDIDRQQGFDNIPATINRLFKGVNQGKQLLTISKPQLPLNTNKFQQVIFESLVTFKSLF